MADLLTQASAVITRESSRLYGSGPSAAGVPLPSVPVASNVGESLLGIAARICPVTGAAIPSIPPDADRLGQQAHELVAGLFGGAGQGGHFLKGSDDADRLRRQAHELIETLLATFSGGTRGSGIGNAQAKASRGAANQVPLLRVSAPVPAGRSGRIEFCVANEEDTPSEVTLYSTDFISDMGHEIPALRVTVTPRRSTVPPKGEAQFAIEIAVPQQTPPGFYSGLIQAMGNRYVKAVLMVEVT